MSIRNYLADKIDERLDTHNGLVSGNVKTGLGLFGNFTFGYTTVVFYNTPWVLPSLAILSVSAIATADGRLQDGPQKGMEYKPLKKLANLLRKEPEVESYSAFSEA